MYVCMYVCIFIYHPLHLNYRSHLLIIYSDTTSTTHKASFFVDAQGWSWFFYETLIYKPRVEHT